jgi:AcrR family transcriptional regulator
MSTAGLRERKKDRTRRELVDAALRLFFEQGFEGTTVEEIAAVAEVSPRTFFRYFGTKEDVLFHEPDENATRQSQILKAIAARPAEEAPLLALREAVLRVVADDQVELPLMMRQRKVLAMNPTLRTRALERQHCWEEAVVDQLGRHGLNAQRSDLEVRLTVAAGAAALRTATDLWLESDGQRDLAQLVIEAFDTLGRGLDLSDATASTTSNTSNTSNLSNHGAQ